MALLTTLWGLLILSVLAVRLTDSMRTETTAVRNQVDALRAASLAEGGIHYGAWQILAGGGTLPSDGTVSCHAVDQGRLCLSIQDESGRIDLNTAPPGLLVSLFQQAGLSVEAAQVMAERLADWRDADDVPRVRGAEDTAYVAAGGAGIANRPFAMVEELRAVLGMEGEVYERVAPLVTVHSGRPTVAVAVAPLEVLTILPGMTAEKLDRILTSRAVPPSGAPTGGPAPGASTVTARADVTGGASAVRQATMRLSAEGPAALEMLAWRTLDSTAFPVPD